MKAKYGLYYVACKVFLRKSNKLFIFKDRYGDWDIPGGRILDREFSAPLELVIKRKIREELGSGIRYRLGKPLVSMRHERKEISLRKRVRIFAIGYEAKFLGGPIRLSSQHTEFLWVSVKTFKPNKYFRGGWFKGVKEI